MNPEEFTEMEEFIGLMQQISAKDKLVTCMAAVTFDDNDMHADDPTHNRPLFITGKANGVNLSCITIDGGFAVNVISARVLSELGVELASS